MRRFRAFSEPRLFGLEARFECFNLELGRKPIPIPGIGTAFKAPIKRDLTSKGCLFFLYISDISFPLYVL